MNIRQILNDNYNAEKSSFLYYLHDEQHFDSNDGS